MPTLDSPTDAPVRVPEITVYFWIVKILTTGAGEAISDSLAHINPAVAAGVGGVGLIVSLVLQFRMRRYLAWTYWFAVLMVAIFGTMAADVVHDGLHIGYQYSTSFFVVALIVIFAWWHRSEHTLSIHSITMKRREGFYWATVIATFALGTAAGDMTADTFGWGYLTSGIVFGLVIALVGIVYGIMSRDTPPERRYDATSTVASFWFAYILTRPLGASFADWFGKPPEKTGLGFGDGTVGLVMLAAIVVVVAFLAITKVDIPEQPDRVASDWAPERA
jgi:uncharacterized membrane-anchored protein